MKHPRFVTGSGIDRMNNKIKCPYCGRTHYVAPHLNVICPCGAKYYIHLREWWSRGATTKVQTNADRIRTMTDEELAKWLEIVDNFSCECCVYQRDCRFEYGAEKEYSCAEGRKEWLKQPVGGNDDEP